MKEFCRAADEDAGLMVENKSRLLKTIKTPVKSEDALPDIVQRQLGYEQDSGDPANHWS